MTVKGTPEHRELMRRYKSAWTNLSLRAGIYKQCHIHKPKNAAYKDVHVEFNRQEFKEFCQRNSDLILSLRRPSVDRIDSSKNYSLSNIQFIELGDNIRKKRHGSAYLNGPKSNTRRGARPGKGGWHVTITINSKCRYLGWFKKEEEEAAFECFYNAYVEHYGKPPWDRNYVDGNKGTT